MDIYVTLIRHARLIVRVRPMIAAATAALRRAAENEFFQIYGGRKSLEPVTRRKIKRGFNTPLVTRTRFRWGLFYFVYLFLFFFPVSS